MSIVSEQPTERRHNINISREELNAMLIRAGHEGGRQALREIGLNDEEAGGDLREIRSLLSMYRDVRSSVLRTFARSITLLLLGALGFAAARRFWGN